MPWHYSTPPHNAGEARDASECCAHDEGRNHSSGSQSERSALPGSNSTDNDGDALESEPRRVNVDSTPFLPERAQTNDPIPLRQPTALRNNLLLVLSEGYVGHGQLLLGDFHGCSGSGFHFDRTQHMYFITTTGELSCPFSLVITLASIR